MIFACLYGTLRIGHDYFSSNFLMRVDDTHGDNKKVKAGKLDKKEVKDEKDNAAYWVHGMDSFRRCLRWRWGFVEPL